MLHVIVCVVIRIYVCISDSTNTPTFKRTETLAHIHSNHIYPTLPLGQNMTQGQFLSGV